MAWKFEKTLDGHFARATGRRKMTTDRGRGYFYVQVEVWAGEEPTGAPYNVWEFPGSLRYDPNEAVRLAVRQTRWPEPPKGLADPRLEVWDFEDPESDQEPVTFIMQRVKRDGRKELLSGCDARGKILLLQQAIADELEQHVWLKIHLGAPGAPVREGSKTMSMVFTVSHIDKIETVPVFVVVEEILPLEVQS